MEAKRLWESMKPRQVPLSEPMDETEVKLIRAFKKNHFKYAQDVSQELEIIQSKTICMKCLLFTHVCQAIGNHVKEYENEDDGHSTVRRYSR